MMDPKKSSKDLYYFDSPISGVQNKTTSINHPSLSKDGCCRTSGETITGNQPHNSAKVGIMCIFDFNETSEDNNFFQRPGSEYDVEKLTEIASFLNYELNIHKNKDKIEILNILKKIHCKNLLTVNGFMCVFLSHGFNGGVFVRDGQLMFDDMKTAINGNSDNRLIDIQKFFIIQACQGNHYEKEVLHNGISLPKSADYGIFVVHNPDPASYHQINGGSSYIQTLCKVAKEHPTKSLLDILSITSYETKMSTTAHMTFTKLFQFPNKRINQHLFESTDCNQPYNSAKVGIICIFDFNETSEDNTFFERPGSEYDVEKLTETASFLNYELNIHKNKDKIEILDILKKIHCKNLLTVNGFMCVFLSHGFNGGVFVKDGQLMFDDMKTAINGNSDNRLIDIQKFFIIQACQGNHYEKEVLHNGISLPKSADYGIFVVHNPDPASYHQINGGSSYIQTLCKVSKEHPTKSIEDILSITSYETKMSTTAHMTFTKLLQFPNKRIDQHLFESTDCSFSQDSNFKTDVCTDSLSFKECCKINDSDNLHTIPNNIPIVAESNTKCISLKTEMVLNPIQSIQFDDSISGAQRDRTSINQTSLAEHSDYSASDATTPEILMNQNQSNEVSEFPCVLPYTYLYSDSPGTQKSSTSCLDNGTPGAINPGAQLYDNTNPGIGHIIYTSDKFLNHVFEMEKDLKWLNCKVYKHKIENGQNILDIIKNLPIIQENISYFVCFFFGFKIKTYDEILVINDIHDAINSNSAQWLIGKPKLFFFENWQVDENKINIDSDLVDQKHITLKEQTSLAEYAGFCFILASTPGTKSLRQCNLGTWLIQTLYEIIKENAKSMSLFDMFPILFSKIAAIKHVDQSGNVFKQMPMVIINL